MARTALTVNEIVRTGLDTSSYTAANSDGHSWDNSGEGVFLHIKNGGGAGITVTIPTPGFVDDDLAIADRTVTVDAAGEKMMGPYRNSTYKQDTDNTVHVDFSDVTSVTILAFKLSNP